jgi:hyperosmotically inducible protein
MRILNSTAACLLVSLILTPAVLAQDATKPGDNTAQNRGDLRKNAVTAQTQNNRKSQVKSLAWIRRHVFHDKALSMNAKNVKILFDEGVVTLQGPVDSDGEKIRVEAIARSYSGTKSVVNELTVVSKTY